MPALDQCAGRKPRCTTPTCSPARAAWARRPSRASSPSASTAERGVTATPCGVCAACTAIDAGRFVDLLELDAASNTGVDNMRELLDNARYAPTRGPLQGLPDRRSAHAVEDGLQRDAEDAGGAAGARQVRPRHDRPAEDAGDGAVALPAVQPEAAAPRPIVGASRHDPRRRRRSRPKPAALQLIARAARGSMRDAPVAPRPGHRLRRAAKSARRRVRTMLGAVDREHAVRIVDALAPGTAAAARRSATRWRSSASRSAAALEELAVAAPAHRGRAERPGRSQARSTTPSGSRALRAASCARGGAARLQIVRAAAAPTSRSRRTRRRDSRWRCCDAGVCAGRRAAVARQRRRPVPPPAPRPLARHGARAVRSCAGRAPVDAAASPPARRRRSRPADARRGACRPLPQDAAAWLRSRRQAESARMAGAARRPDANGGDHAGDELVLALPEAQRASRRHSAYADKLQAALEQALGGTVAARVRGRRGGRRVARRAATAPSAPSRRRKARGELPRGAVRARRPRPLRWPASSPIRSSRLR